VGIKTRGKKIESTVERDRKCRCISGRKINNDFYREFCCTFQTARGRQLSATIDLRWDKHGARSDQR